MPISFYTEINEFNYLTSSCYFASKIQHELSYFFDQNHPFSIESLKESLLSILKNIPFLPQSYFDNFYERFFYEIIFDVYNTIGPLNKQTPSIRECITEYTKDSRQLASLEQDISHKKKDLHNDYEKLKCYCTNHKKLANFYSYLIPPPK